MAMGQDYSVEVAAFELGIATVLHSLFFAALKKATINEDARVLRYHVIRRSGNVASRPMKVNLHNLFSSCSKGPAPVNNLRPIYAEFVRIVATANLHVPEFLFCVGAG